MNDDALRNRFLAFAGPAKYRKFVGKCSPVPGESYQEWYKGLRFWAEKLWDDFIHASEFQDVSIAILVEAFRVCPVHNEGMSSGVPMFDPLGISRLHEDFEHCLDTEFPFGFLPTRLVCPTCLRSCCAWLDSKAWENSSADKFTRCLAKYRRLVENGPVRREEVFNDNLVCHLLPLDEATLESCISTLTTDELECFDSFFARQVRPHDYMPRLLWVSNRYSDIENEATAKRLRPRYFLIDALVRKRLAGR